MRIYKLLLLLLFISFSNYSQELKQPKLIVGIVIDQMRYDYLTKFSKFYGKDGFNRLINEGSNFTYTHVCYVPTFTAVGHSSIYTGTTPYFHGIISNDWFDREEGKMVSSIEDHSVKGIGEEENEGKASPKRLLATTITDQLKLATNGKSKVFSISIKDRAAILPGGHAADAAFWYSSRNGNFISSSYYLNNLPEWVEKFNKRKLSDSLSSLEWNLSLPDSDYSLSSPDESDYEKDVFSEGRTSFPHSLRNVEGKEKYSTLISTPFCNDLLIEFFKAAVINENLGKHSVPDFLAVSFSSTDYIGHAYGPNSVEIQDTYIKLDKQIANLLSFLDNQAGKGNYLLFLTADHAVMESVGHLQKLKIPADGSNDNYIFDSLKSFAGRTFHSDDFIENFSNRQIFLNKKIILKNNFVMPEVEKKFADYLINTFPQIALVSTREELMTQTAQRSSNDLILNGFNFKRSGDIILEWEPDILPGYKKGSSHGSRYNYDTHIPLIFFGWHIPAKTINTPVYNVDIAPTIADLIGITEPDECIGIPIIKKD